MRWSLSYSTRWPYSFQLRLRLRLRLRLWLRLRLPERHALVSRRALLSIIRLRLIVTASLQPAGQPKLCSRIQWVLVRHGDA